MAANQSLLKTGEAAAYLGLSKSSLEKMRLYGVGPVFVRLAGRSIRYRPADLDAWVNASLKGSTSEYEARA